MTKISPACLRVAQRCPAVALTLLGSLGLVACARGPAISKRVNDGHRVMAQYETIACPLGGKIFSFRMDRFSTAKGIALDMQPYGAEDLPWPLPQ